MYNEDSYRNVHQAAQTAVAADDLARKLANDLLHSWAEQAVEGVPIDGTPQLPLSRKAVESVSYAYGSGPLSDTLALARQYARAAWRKRHGSNVEVKWGLICTDAADGSIVFKLER